LQLVTCQNCGKENVAGIRRCVNCGATLEAPAASTPPPAPAGGSRLSRLAQARLQKEAEGKIERDTGDWFSGLRSDEPPPADYATRTDADEEDDTNIPPNMLAEPTRSGGDALLFDAPAIQMPQAPRVETYEPATPHQLDDYTARLLEEAEPEKMPYSPPPASPAPAPAENPVFGTGKDDTVPDWLKSLQGNDTNSNPTSIFATPAPEPEPPAPTPVSAPNRKETDSLPDWLREMRPDNVGEPATAAPASTVPGMADWLKDTPSPEPEPAVKPKTDDVPDWLQVTTDSLKTPNRPSLGDENVEQVLGFAFDDEAGTRPINTLDLLGGMRQTPTGGLQPIPEFKIPPAYESEFKTPNPMALPFMDSEDFPPIPEPATASSFSLPPWLEGLPIPTMEETAAQTPDEIAPWLAGMNVPQTQAPAANFRQEMPPELVDIAPEQVQMPPRTGTTRPFSVKGLFEDEPDMPPVPSANMPSVDLPNFNFDDGEEGGATEVLPFAPPAFENRTANISIPQSEQPRLSDLTEGESARFEPELRGLFGEAKIGNDGSATQSAISPTPAAPASNEDSLPDFLRDTSATPATTPESDSTPDWLRGMVSSGDTAPGAPPTQNDAAEVPDWLRDANEAKDNATAKPAQATTPGGSLDFLRAEADEMAAQQNEDDEAVPDWLQQMSAGTLPVVKPKTIEGYTPMNTGEAQVDDSQVPDWLKNEAAKPAPAPAAPEPDWLRAAMPKSATDNLAPDWLNDTDSYLASGEPSPPMFAIEPEPSKTIGEADSAPDWLKNMAATGSVPEPTQASAPSEPANFDWLNQNDTSDTKLPDWLQAAGATQSEPPKTDETEKPGEFDKLSAGLGALAGGAAVVGAGGAIAAKKDPEPDDQPAVFVPANEPEAESEFARLLRDIETEKDSPAAGSATIPEWLREKSATGVNEPGLNIGAELPDWLHEAEATSPSQQALDDLTAENRPTPTPTAPVSPPQEARRIETNEFNNFLGDLNTTPSSGFLGDTDGPAWLRSANAPKKPPTAPLESIGTLPSEPGGIPSWLKSVAPATVEEDIAAPASTTATLPGLPSLPANIGTPGATTGTPTLPQVNLPPELASTAVLRALIASNAAVVETPAPETERELKRRMRPALVARLVLSFLLLAATLFALFAPLPVTPPAITPQVQAFYDRIEALPGEARVLVVHDYEADRSGEMRPLAQAVTQHILAKRARLLNFSLTPQGPALAQQVADELISRPEYGNTNFYSADGSRNYLNLGWRPGNEAAVRGLYGSLGDLTNYRTGQPARDYEPMAGLNALSDFNLIVVLAGDESSVRTWVEQAGIQPGANLLLGVPQAVEPVARPYAQGLESAQQQTLTTERTPRSAALLAGSSQTVQYDQLLRQRNVVTDQRTTLDNRLRAQSVAAIFLILVIVGVNIYYFTRRQVIKD
jgi:hypothetical protein